MEEYKGQPRPQLQLVGIDGNAFNIVGKAAKAMKRARCSAEHIKAYQAEAMSGDYDHLIQVTMTFCDCD